MQPLWKTIWGFLKKLKIELPYNPEIPPLAIYSKELKAGSQRYTCTPMFIAALFTIAKRWKQHKYLSTDEWISKTWSIHTMEYYSAFKKEENSGTCYNMDES